MNKTALFLSATLTVIVLIAVGAVVWSMGPARAAQDTGAASAAAADPAQGAQAAATSTSTIDPALEKVWMEREAAYQKTIAEANARLDQLQKQLAPTAAPAVTAQTAQITADQAAAIAANYLGQPAVYAVNLILLGGGQVYEVMFAAGDIVYVSLDGQVVGSVPAPAISSGGGGGGKGIQQGGGGESGEHEGEHESEGGEGDHLTGCLSAGPKPPSYCHSRRIIIHDEQTCFFTPQARYPCRRARPDLYSVNLRYARLVGAVL